MRYHSGITWFDESVWINRQITFENSTWQITHKLKEREIPHSKDEVESWGLDSEAHGIFVCVNTRSRCEDAVVKVRMQIPYIKTAYNSGQERAEQAPTCVSGLHPLTQFEVNALKGLTLKGCSSTPKFMGSKFQAQGSEDWVPGGYLDYVLMEKMSGTRPPAHWERVPQQERDTVLAAFKRAYLECRACGWKHDDPGVQNILWDSEKGKCYLVDWEDCTEIEPDAFWREGLYVMWNLKSDY
ncbi:hypothetical protein BDV25DRAFT_109225 [Aspergillus avenaceus]|uniref:Uncharacterized protein n=1 Tax=Aspergillus avenaceus TaxID=36643 RepID=A0A5N6U721_ASPAV|nr:hypothetical protein BDV25DRAFT_109225 [Aspergillus avenaceus]